MLSFCINVTGFLSFRLTMISVCKKNEEQTVLLIATNHNVFTSNKVHVELPPCDLNTKKIQNVFRTDRFQYERWYVGRNVAWLSYHFPRVFSMLGIIAICIMHFIIRSAIRQSSRCHRMENMVLSRSPVFLCDTKDHFFRTISVSIRSPDVCRELTPGSFEVSLFWKLYFHFRNRSAYENSRKFDLPGTGFAPIVENVRIQLTNSLRVPIPL